MKFNFKKVASVLAATIMLGSTVSFAAAAWPAPFVQDGSSAAAVVYGANAPSTGGDKAAAINLGAELDKSITSTVTSGSDGTGDKIKLSKTTNLFNLNENINSFYPTLDSEELSMVLADGVYTNDDNDEFEYEQSIVLGGMVLNQQQDDDFNGGKPFIGFDLTSGQPVLNYTLDFTTDAEAVDASWTGLRTTNLEMLGMSYYIVDTAATNGGTLTLLDNANEAVISEGEEKTVTVGDNSYNVKVSYIADSTADGKTILEVNGVKTNILEKGDVFKVASDTYIAVKNVLFNSKESGISQVEFSIGSGKIELFGDGDEVKMNGEEISESTDQILRAYITNSSADHTISQIKMAWTLDDDFWLAPGSDLLLPGFETVKLSMEGFNMPNSETTTLKNDGKDVFAVTTEITNGNIKLPILWMNSSTTGIGGYGSDDNELLVINTTAGTATAGSIIRLNETQNSYFVATFIDGDDYETYAFEIDSIDDANGENATTLKNLADSTTVKFSGVNDDADKGNINMELIAANDNAKTASIKLTSATSSGLVHTDRIVTKEGLQIVLPTNATGSLISANAASAYVNMTEEDDNGNVAAGSSLLATITVDADDGAEVTTISPDTKFETEEDSDKYEDYLLSKLGTKIMWDMPSSGLNTLEVIYAGEESSADVYIAESSAAVGAVKDSVKVVTDAEVDSVKSKNLIVVGGSCINTVAASMLGSTSPVCGDSWASQTGTGPGKYLIQVAASPVNAEKIAMLIAGYETADTQNAVAKVKEGAVSTEVGTKLVGPVAA